MQNNLPVIYEDPYEFDGHPSNRTETESTGRTIRNNLRRIISQLDQTEYQPLESIEMSTINRQFSQNSGYIDPREAAYPNAKSTVKDILDKEIRAAETLRVVKKQLEKAIKTIEPFEKSEKKPAKCCCFKIIW